MRAVAKQTGNHTNQALVQRRRARPTIHGCLMYSMPMEPHYGRLDCRLSLFNRPKDSERQQSCSRCLASDWVAMVGKRYIAGATRLGIIGLLRALPPRFLADTKR